MIHSLKLLESKLDLKLITKSFLVCSLFIIIFIVFDFTQTLVHQNQKIASAKPNASTFVSKVFEPLTNYDDVFKKSHLLGYSEENNLSVFKSSISELIKDYRLKGIVQIGEPEAIIEDARVQKTVFLKSGDSLGELKIKTVKEDGIVVTYYSEEKEIKLT